MGVNKVVYNTADGAHVLIDLTGDNVSEETVFQGTTFHGADGDIKQGTFTIAEEMAEQDSMISQIKTALMSKSAVDLAEEITEQDSLIAQIKNALLAKVSSAK